MSESLSDPNAPPDAGQTTPVETSDPDHDPIADVVRKLVVEADAAPVPREPPPAVIAEIAPAVPPQPTFDYADEPSRRGEAAKWLKRLAARAQRQLARFLRRPDAPRLIAIVLLVVVFLVVPWFVVGLAAVALLSAAVAYFTLGPDRVGELVSDWHARLRDRDPQKAEQLQRRASRASKAVATCARYLPERWTSGLYLPDFETRAETSPKMASDPFDKLAAQINEGQAGKTHR